MKPVAFYLLTGYETIFVCLNEGELPAFWKNTEAKRQWLRRMHEELPGPVIFGEKGERSQVIRITLFD